jgi:hypothetical protein
MRYADLDLVLGELQKEGGITRLPSPTVNEMISLRRDSKSMSKGSQEMKLVAVHPTAEMP